MRLWFQCSQCSCYCVVLYRRLVRRKGFRCKCHKQRLRMLRGQQKKQTMKIGLCGFCSYLFPVLIYSIVNILEKKIKNASAKSHIVYNLLKINQPHTSLIKKHPRGKTSPPSLRYVETLNFLNKNTANAVFLENSWLRGMGFAKIMIFAATADFCCRKPAYCRLPNPCGEPPCSVVQIQHNTHI